ncbi:CRP-like cAMP-binding protein [Bradyrhizobium sp. USDA 4341]
MTQLDHIEELLKAWDEMDHAAQRVANSLPDKLSESVARLEKARHSTRDVVQRVALALAKRNMSADVAASTVESAESTSALESHDCAGPAV